MLQNGSSRARRARPSPEGVSKHARGFRAGILCNGKVPLWCKIRSGLGAFRPGVSRRRHPGKEVGEQVAPRKGGNMSGPSRKPLFFQGYARGG